MPPDVDVSCSHDRRAHVPFKVRSISSALFHYVAVCVGTLHALCTTNKLPPSCLLRFHLHGFKHLPVLTRESQPYLQLCILTMRMRNTNQQYLAGCCLVLNRLNVACCIARARHFPDTSHSTHTWRALQSELSPSHMQDLMSLTGKTRFCPALPGDSASSRRLSEIFLAGCIPVQAPIFLAT